MCVCVTIYSILEYVCSESTLATPINPTDHPSKTAVAKEEQLMEKFKVSASVCVCVCVCDDCV